MRKNIEKKKKKKPPRPRGCRSRSRRPPGEARPVGSPHKKKFFWISITKPGISVCKSLKKKKFPPTPRLPMSLKGKPCSSPEESHRGRTPTPSAAKCRFRARLARCRSGDVKSSQSVNPYSISESHYAQSAYCVT